MDADDVSCPERLEKQVMFLENHPEIDLLGSGAAVFCGDGQVVGIFPVSLTHEEICSQPWSGFRLAHPTWMGKREWFIRYGYSENARRAQDQDLLLRAHRESRFACLPDILLGYRQDGAAVRNVVAGRFHYGRALWRYACRNRLYGLAVKGVWTQCLRSLVAVVAIGLGGARLLVRRRVVRAQRDQLDLWHKCWRQ
jgi:hypothetical protein